MSDQRSAFQIVSDASQAIGRVDRDGMRGVTTLSAQQIEAMAVLLACLGLVAWHPGAPEPETFFVGEAA